MKSVLVASALILAASSAAEAGPNGRVVVTGGWGCQSCGFSNGTSQYGLVNSNGLFVVETVTLSTGEAVKLTAARHSTND